MRNALIATSLFLVFFTAASAAEIEVTSNRLSDRSHPIQNHRARLDRWIKFRQDCYNGMYSLQTEVEITITGRIEAGDAQRFAAVAKPFFPTSNNDPDAINCPGAVVILNSSGGEVREAIALGREIARGGFATVVLQDGQCLSACFFVFLGGSYMGGYPSHMVMFRGARVGIHQPQFSPTVRERRILGLAPEEEQIDQAFALAGEEWKDITRFVVEERRASYVMQRLLASPQEAQQFDYFDTYEELYFAGIVFVDTLWHGPGQEIVIIEEPSRSSSDADGEKVFVIDEPLEYSIDADLARRVCALPEIKDGELADLSDSYATQFAPGWIVGLNQIDRFCYVTVSDDTIYSCLFDSTIFEYKNGDSIDWIDQWNVGYMGFYPVTMFDLSREVTSPPDEISAQAIGEFFSKKFEKMKLCQTEQVGFYITDLIAFEKHMRLSSECLSATRLCE